MAGPPLITTIVDRKRYETSDRYEPSGDHYELLDKATPDDWTLSYMGVWLKASPPNPSRDVPQGFKIHVSSIAEDVEETIEAVVPVCVERSTGFKIAADSRILSLFNSKLYARGKSGKFMTIYPADLEAFEETIEAVYQAVKDRDLRGPYILSDRRYKDSRTVFYRYGGFRPPRRMRLDGSAETLLVSPDGSAIADDRTPFFNLPDWVDDPFPQEPDDDEGDIVLYDRYRVEGVYDVTNSGGVYDAVDTTTDERVVIKEARPFTQYWQTESGYRDAVDLLERERSMLEDLSSLPYVPALVDYFQEWEHSFLVMEKIEATTYNTFWALPANILSPFIRRPGRIDTWSRTFAGIATDLIAAVEGVHDLGVTLGDLSPGNVMINADDHSVYLIDFESAVRARDQADFIEFSRSYATPGYVRPDRVSESSDGQGVTKVDDYYALGMLLYSTFMPTTAYFQMNADARDAFMTRFNRLGIPVAVTEVISELLKGSLTGAKTRLQAWVDTLPPVPADPGTPEPVVSLA
jgi:tRNA A-37 threonylcarbamoyl transferase component Bud32